MDDLYIAAANTDKMICLHINDAIAGIGRGAQKDLIRAMPMSTGVIDSAKIYKLFLDKGFTGPMLLEPILPAYGRFEKMIPEEVVIEVADSYKNVKKIAENI